MSHAFYPAREQTLVAAEPLAVEKVVLLDAERDFYAVGEKVDVHLLGTSTALGY